MAIQAISRAPFPVENQSACIHEWVIDGDARSVRLLLEGENNLICRVFNRVTNESSERFIRYPQNAPFESLSAYATYISANMRAELGSSRQGPTCTAMLVKNSQQLVHAWYTGPNGEIEIKLFRNPGSPKGPCIAMDTSSNKQKIFALTKEIGPENARLFEPLITFDVHGFPNTLDFQAIKLNSFASRAASFVKDLFAAVTTRRPIIQAEPVLVPSGEVGELPHWDSQEWAVVREWDLGDGKKVRLCRFGDKFCSKYAHSGDFTKRKVVTPMPIPPYLSADEVATDVTTNRYPFIHPDGSVDYLTKSKLSDKIIDELHWAVTIVDVGSSESLDVLTWGGHAVIVIESFEDDNYRIQRADLVKKNGLAVVRFRNTSLDELLRRAQGSIHLKDLPRTTTWIRTKRSVESMIEQIALEVGFSKRREQIKVAHRGNRPLRFAATGGSPDEDYVYCNCMSWAIGKLSLASVRLNDKMGMTMVSRYTGSSAKNTMQDIGAALGVSSIPTAVVAAMALSVGGGVAVAVVITAGSVFPILLIISLTGASFDDNE